MTRKFGIKLETYLSIVWCKVYFDSMNRVGVTFEYNRQTDRRMDGETDFSITNTALHYVARPKCTQLNRRQKVRLTCVQNLRVTHHII